MAGEIRLHPELFGTNQGYRHTKLHTETSDSGMAESRVAPSELRMEETSGKIHLIWINVVKSYTINQT